MHRTAEDVKDFPVLYADENLTPLALEAAVISI
jgi:hypothetical protein